MEITVKMTVEDLLEFNEFQKERATYQQRAEKTLGKLEYFARRICWALGEDPKKEGKVKIIDQEFAQELLEQAGDFLGLDRKETGYGHE